MTEALSPELEEIVRQHPPSPPVDRIWDEAIEQAYQGSGMRGGLEARGGPETPAERLVRLRDKLKGELVAFHDRLRVEPYTGEIACPAGRRLWSVGVPLTLFPRRDQGFSRLECIVELRSEGAPESFRVVKTLPEPRAAVVGKAELGAKLELATGAKLGGSLLLPGVKLVGEVATEIYGSAQAEFHYELRRECVVSEIVGGSGGRWRLDDLTHPEQVSVEGHQVALIVEAAEAAAPLHAAGVLQAYSDVRWLTSSLGSVWQSLKGRVLAFFNRGAPVEAYGEWRDVLPRRPW